MKSTDMKMGGGMETRQEITQGLNISRKKKKKKSAIAQFTHLVNMKLNVIL